MLLVASPNPRAEVRYDEDLQTMAREQEQFLNVVDRDTAERLWRDAIRPVRLGAELVPLSAALGRVLAEDVISEVDVPSFDRSNVDGYALAPRTRLARRRTPLVVCGSAPARFPPVSFLPIQWPREPRCQSPPAACFHEELMRFSWSSTRGSRQTSWW